MRVRVYKGDNGRIYHVIVLTDPLNNCQQEKSVDLLPSFIHVVCEPRQSEQCDVNRDKH